MDDNQDTDITELVEFDVSNVDGVFSPANGFSFLMIKSADGSLQTVTPTMTEREMKRFEYEQAMEGQEQAPDTPADKLIAASYLLDDDIEIMNERAEAAYGKEGPYSHGSKVCRKRILNIGDELNALGRYGCKHYSDTPEDVVAKAVDQFAMSKAMTIMKEATNDPTYRNTWLWAAEMWTRYAQGNFKWDLPMPEAM